MGNDPLFRGRSTYKEYKEVFISSLCQFSVEDILNKIKKWICNDSHYMSNLAKTKRIFLKHLNAQKIAVLSRMNVKQMIKEEMLEFMTESTLNIMMTGFSLW